MDEEAVAELIQFKKDRMGVPLPVLLKEARAKGILPSRHMVSYATIYRIFKLHTGSRRAITPIPTGEGLKRNSRMICGSRTVCMAQRSFTKGG
jgi:hypothetical protein